MDDRTGPYVVRIFGLRFVGPVRGPDFRSELEPGPVCGKDFGPKNPYRGGYFFRSGPWSGAKFRKLKK